MSDFTSPTTDLCDICASLDVRKLWLAAKDYTTSLITPGVWDGFSTPVALDGWNTLQLDSLHEVGDEDREQNRHVTLHHSGLLELKRAAVKCPLCAKMWLCFCRDAEISSKIPDDEFSQILANSVLRHLPLYVAIFSGHGEIDQLSKLICFQFEPQQEHTKIIANFALCVRRRHVPSECIRFFAYTLSSNAESVECLDLAREWLRKCRAEHPSCSDKTAKLRRPARLLYLTDDGIRLVDTTGNEEYVALTYCWGGEKVLTLQQQTVDNPGTEQLFRKGLPSAAIPPETALADAIAITRELGYQFCWIDALTILQNSDKDWQDESAKMRDIYRGAVLTIGGTSQAKISERLLHIREISYIPLRWRNEDQAPEFIYLCEESTATDMGFQISPISKRGWCLQENLLSTRSLWTGKQQMIFECAHSQVDETGREVTPSEIFHNKRLIHSLQTMEKNYLRTWIFRACGIPPVVWTPWCKLGQSSNSILGRLFGKRVMWMWAPVFIPAALTIETSPGYRVDLTIYDVWREIVCQYCRRQLTFPRDTLPALSGLAEAFQRATGETYLAGLWSGNIISGLLWRRGYHADNPDPHDAYTKHYLAPSWSWASMPGELSGYGPGDREGYLSEKAQVLKAWTSPSTADPHGMVSGGEIVLRVSFIPFTDPRCPAQENFAFPLLYSAMDHSKTDRQEFKLKHKDHTDQEFAMIKLCSLTHMLGKSYGRKGNVDVQMVLIETCENVGAVMQGSSGARKWRRVDAMRVVISGPLFGETIVDNRPFVSASEWEITLAEEVRNIPWRKEVVILI